jgi:hypothetical protein
MYDTSCTEDRSGITFEVSSREGTNDSIDLLRFGLKVQLLAQISERVDQILASHIEVLHIVAERNMIDGTS